jgi:hypothetical protein
MIVNGQLLIIYKMEKLLVLNGKKLLKMEKQQKLEKPQELEMLKKLIFMQLMPHI